MQAHQVEATLSADGTLILKDLPFPPGQAVQVIIVARPGPFSPQTRGSLRGSVIRYEGPADPVAEQDWEALQ